jgi:hypothetical protein
MSEPHNRLNGLGNMPPAKPTQIKPGAVLKPLHSAFDPTQHFYLVRAKRDNQAGLTPGSLHHVAGMNFMAELMELIDPVTQEPPVYVARFEDVEIVARNQRDAGPKVEGGSK